MTVWVDNSILESVAKCSTQALMSYVFHWATAGNKLVANVGKAIHAAHQVWFSTWHLIDSMKTTQLL